MSTDDYAIIERYLKNISDDHERRMLEERLLSDLEFKNAFDKEQRLFLSISKQHFTTIDQSIQDSFSELEEEGFFEKESNQNKSKSRSLVIWLISSAAFIASLFLYANIQYSSNKIFQSGNQKIGFDIPQISRSTNQPVQQTDLAKAKLLISDAKWDKAIDVLSSISNTHVNYLDGQLHVAYIYFKTDRQNQSIAVLDNIIIQTIDPVKKHSAEWLKLQALIKSDQPYESLMQQIMDDPKHTFRNDAVQAHEKRSRFWRKLLISN